MHPQRDHPLWVYSTFSAIQRETAVTILRGAKRTDSATSQLCAPEMTRVLPVIRPRYPSRATFSASMAPSCLNRREPSDPARLAKPVWVAPGQKQVTVTPEWRSSLARASENESTYAFVA